MNQKELLEKATKYDVLCQSMQARLNIILKPHRRYIKELIWWRNLCLLLDIDKSILDQFQALIDEYYQKKKQAEINKLQMQGYKVTRNK
jgi:hypothetical protein